MAPLHYVAKCGNSEALQQLFKARADVNVGTEPEKKTALLFSLEHGHHDLCLELLDAKADPDAADITGTTAVSYARSKGLYSLCQMLIDHSTHSKLLAEGMSGKPEQPPKTSEPASVEQKG
jgi:uncharacterized protein